jgi:uncharacterized protein DUF6901
MSKNNENLTIRYKFSFENGLTKEFVVTLDGKTLHILSNPQATPPAEWTLLQFNKCPNCPLDEKKYPQCPIAANMVDVVNFFKDLVSYEKTYMMIESGNRNFIGKVSLQEGIKSLVGVYMVTSGCPIMDHLRPMLRVHLPFPNMEESVYRLISMYLLAQYFVFREGKRPDWEMRKLLSLCNEIQTVNRSFFKRLRGLKVKDASLNALVALDSIAAYTASFLEDNNLDDMKSLFKVYLDRRVE